MKYGFKVSVRKSSHLISSDGFPLYFSIKIVTSPIKIIYQLIFNLITKVYEFCLNPDSKIYDQISRRQTTSRYLIWMFLVRAKIFPWRLVFGQFNMQTAVSLDFIHSFAFILQKFTCSLVMSLVVRLPHPLLISLFMVYVSFWPLGTMQFSLLRNDIHTCATTDFGSTRDILLPGNSMWTFNWP